MWIMKCVAISLGYLIVAVSVSLEPASADAKCWQELQLRCNAGWRLVVLYGRYNYNPRCGQIDSQFTCDMYDVRLALNMMCFGKQVCEVVISDEHLKARCKGNILLYKAYCVKAEDTVRLREMQVVSAHQYGYFFGSNLNTASQVTFNYRPSEHLHLRFFWWDSDRDVWFLKCLDRLVITTDRFYNIDRNAEKIVCTPVNRPNSKYLYRFFTQLEIHKDVLNRGGILLSYDIHVYDDSKPDIKVDEGTTVLPIDLPMQATTTTYAIEASQGQKASGTSVLTVSLAVVGGVLLFIILLVSTILILMYVRSREKQTISRDQPTLEYRPEPMENAYI